MEAQRHKTTTGPIGRPRVGSILVLVLSLAGCAPMTQIDPPQLQLDTGPGIIVPPHITHVTIKNGAGEVLLDGKPDGKGSASANPDTSKLDGTLAITSLWSDGTTATQTLTHEPGKPVTVSRIPEMRRFKAESQEPPKVEEKKESPGWGEFLGGVLGGINMGIGGRGGRDRGGDRRHPNPCAGK